MRKEQILTESKNYLIYVHDTLRRTFQFSDTSEWESVAKILASIESDVTQLENLIDILKTKDIKEKRKIEITEE